MSEAKQPDPARAADAAVAVKQKLYPSLSVDQLLCRPDDAKDLCEQVRRRLGRKAADLEDCVILHGLLNARKRSRLPANK